MALQLERYLFCQLGVKCPSSAQGSLYFMRKLIAVTTKLQLVRQPARQCKQEFQAARAFLMENSVSTTHSTNFGSLK